MQNPNQSIQEGSSTQTAVFGGGCFWCTEAVFVRVKGVTDVESAYCNGHVHQPSYEQVCDGNTGHVEVVQLRYDDEQVSLSQLLEVFFAVHDPTTLNRQGADHGTQYRSIIVAQTPSQLEIAKKSLAQAQSRFRSPIVTEIIEGPEFFPAEAYHQDFYERNPNHPYNRAVIAPKLEKLKSVTGKN